MKRKLISAAAVLLFLCVLCGCSLHSPSVEKETTTTAAAGTDMEADTDVTASEASEAQTSAAETTAAPSGSEEAKLYAAYLTTERYEELLYEDFDEDYDDFGEMEYEAEAALADINDDGVRELLLHITNKTMGGVRGNPSVTVLLGVRDGKVEELGFADYPGGSGGGDYLFFKYDTTLKKHVLEYEEYVRDGMFASTLTLYYFDVAQYNAQDNEYGMGGDGFVRYKTAHTLRSDTFCKQGVYAENAERILRENNLCKEEDDFVTSYTYDGDYLSESDFDAMRERFVEPTDPAYQMKPVTLENPIPAF